jgi:hypothetical protein
MRWLKSTRKRGKTTPESFVALSLLQEMERSGFLNSSGRLAPFNE